MMTFIRTLLIVCLLCTGFAVAGNQGLDSPFSFGVGARDLALSGAGSVISDPVTAIFWNASVIADAERMSLGLFQSRLYDSDVAYQYAGLIIPTMDRGSFGVGVCRLGIDGIERRDANNFPSGEFDDSRLGFYFAYARHISKYRVGISVTLERHSLDEYSATSSPGLNLSISRVINLNSTLLPEIVLGINGRNLIRPSVKLVNESVKYPYSVDMAVALKLLPTGNRNHELNLSASAKKTDQVDPQAAVGLEYNIHDLLSLRGSMAKSTTAAGVGLNIKSINFDYALVNRDLGSIHMFSLTSHFGSDMSEKRKKRRIEQEANFNELMNDNLNVRNHEMIEELFSQAHDALEKNEYDQAEMILDRGLFIAVNNALDTTVSYREALETRELLKGLSQKKTFETYMDSAQTHYGEQSLLSARYFTSLALDILPNSPDANRLLENINIEIENNTSKEQMIESGLFVADSLIDYGRLDQALITLKELEQFAGDNNHIKTALRKANFDYQRKIAGEAYDQGDYKTASAAIDSAEILLPDHPWCRQLSQKIKKRLTARNTPRIEEKAPQRKELSNELLKEVEVAYKEGQKLFTDGNLESAILEWEKVNRIAPDYKSIREYLVKAYKYVGVELYGKNLLQEAVDIWEKALTLEPDNGELNSYILRTQNEISRLEELSYDPEQ
jgi:tetratricopeptide (TPR) repeat protein